MSVQLFIHSFDSLIEHRVGAHPKQEMMTIPSSRRIRTFPSVPSVSDSHWTECEEQL